MEKEACISSSSQVLQSNICIAICMRENVMGGIVEMLINT
jgi:hypothetical protein